MKGRLTGYYIDSEPKVNILKHIPPDNGCKAAKEYYGYHGKCLDCPLKVCIEDGMRSPYYVRSRRLKIEKLIREGKFNYEIANILGVSSRTIQRELKLIKKDALKLK